MTSHAVTGQRTHAARVTEAIERHLAIEHRPAPKPSHCGGCGGRIAPNPGYAGQFGHAAVVHLDVDRCPGPRS